MYGGIGRDFLKFMGDIITAHAQGRGREGNPRAACDREMRRVAVGVAEYPPNACAVDALIDWDRRISVALTRSVGCRLQGTISYSRRKGRMTGVYVRTTRLRVLGGKPDLGVVIV